MYEDYAQLIYVCVRDLDRFNEELYYMMGANEIIYLDTLVYDVYNVELRVDPRFLGSVIDTIRKDHLAVIAFWVIRPTDEDLLQ